MAVSPARRGAFEILLAVERRDAHSDELLRGDRVSALAPADRNLVTALVLGVLRWQIRLDRQIRAHLRRPDAKLDAEILIALRLGAFQLLFLDRIPAHAAIGESVELAKRAGHRYASGLVNAVLRKLAARERRPGNLGEQRLVSEHDFGLADAFPAWMVGRWEQNYGSDAARAVCMHGQNQPRLSLRMEDARAAAELAAIGIEFAPGEFLTMARTVTAGDITATEAVREGRVRIQDEGSQLIGEMAACAVAAAGPGQKKFLDACAAPGGKTLILAERHPEAQIVACEANPRRLAQLQARLSALAGRIECRLADAAALREDTVFDLVLADVPCSGTGTLGRNPEIRHRLRAEDLPRQAERQRAILRAALRGARPGGRVVYSTCSLEPEENEQVVAAVLTEYANVRQISVMECIEAMLRSGLLSAAGAERLATCIAPNGALRLLPGVFGTDGFFVAVLERTA